MFAFLNNQSLSCAYPEVKETIPPSMLGYQTNTRFPSFPPLMQDGRAVISSWQPEAVINNRILKDNRIQSNWEYRKYLNAHSKEILEHNFQEACNDTGYTVPIQVDALPLNPYLFRSIEDRRPTLGVEYSDLKKVYLTREELEARRTTTTITQAELVKNFGIA